jgi:hypothetical protein
MAQHARLLGHLLGRRVDADLRGAHAERVIATRHRDVGQLLQRHRGFALGEILLAHPYRQRQLHGVFLDAKFAVTVHSISVLPRATMGEGLAGADAARRRPPDLNRRAAFSVRS